MPIFAVPEDPSTPSAALGARLADGDRLAFMSNARIVVLDTRSREVRSSEPVFNDGEQLCGFAHDGLVVQSGARRLSVPYGALAPISPAVAAVLFKHPEPLRFIGENWALVERTDSFAGGLARGISRFIQDADSNEAPDVVEARADEAHRGLCGARDSLACDDPGTFAVECARIARETALGHGATRDPRLLEAAFALSSSADELLRLYAIGAIPTAFPTGMSDRTQPVEQAA